MSRDSFLTRYRRPFLTGLVFGLVVVAGVLVLSDAPAVGAAMAGFYWPLLPIILLLAPLNYILRYVKWSYYLRLADLHPKPSMSRLIFASGLSMTVTPGKVGELLKCYLMKEHMGAPVSVTSSIVLAERVSDSISVGILAVIGAAAFAHGLYLMAFIALGLIGLVGALHNRLLASFLQRTATRLRGPALGASVESFYVNTRKFLKPGPLFLAVALGVVSWGLEGLIVYLAVVGMGGDISVLASIFAVAFSSLVGAVSTLPGGLGAAEGSIIGLLILAGLSGEMAAAAALITRFSTLWLGVLIGAAALYLAERRLRKESNRQ